MRFLLQFFRQRRPRQLRCAFDQRHKQIRVVIRNLPLQHRCQPLQPRPGINRRLRQWIQLPIGVAVELHEHQVPNLDVPPTVASECAIRVSLIRRRWPHVVMNLAARSARAGVAHLPEIVFQSKFVNPLFRHALRHPEIAGLGIARHPAFALENRHKQLVVRDPKPLRRSDQLPGVRNRVFFEVVAKAEVPQHLEKRVVAVGKADVFKIIVFAPGAHTFLRTRGPRVIAFFQAEKHVFELVHPRVGKKQSGIIRRDERRRVDLFVSVLEEIIQKFAANLRAGQHETGESLYVQGQILG